MTGCWTMDTDMFIAKDPEELYDKDAKPLVLSKVAEAFAVMVQGDDPETRDASKLALVRVTGPITSLLKEAPINHEFTPEQFT